MRRHAHDPAWHQEVIQQDDPDGEMRWDRWVDWRAGDPRWRVRIIDTSDTPVEQVAGELSSWIDEEQALLRSGRHPLGAIALRKLDRERLSKPGGLDED